MGYRPKQAALDAQKALQSFLAGLEVPWPDEDVRVAVVYYPRVQAMDVTVTRLRDRPAGFAGRRRDLASLLDVTLDAMQETVYRNDNQVADLAVMRCYDFPPEWDE